MATIINNPSDGDGNVKGSGGMIVGIVVAIILLVVFFLFILPAMRSANRSSGTTNINVPDKVNVDVQKSN